jgi:hypothetical protein
MQGGQQSFNLIDQGEQRQCFNHKVHPMSHTVHPQAKGSKIGADLSNIAIAKTLKDIDAINIERSQLLSNFFPRKSPSCINALSITLVKLLDP